MTDPATELHALHAQFCKATGQTMRYGPCERRLYEFRQAGFTAEDLALVLAWIKAQNARNDYKYSTKFGNVIDPERFNDMLGEASVWQRKRQKRHELMPEAKRDILGATFRDNEPEARTPFMSLREVLEKALQPPDQRQ